MTISGRPEFGLEDVPWTLAAHRFDVLRTSIGSIILYCITLRAGVIRRPRPVATSPWQRAWKLGRPGV